MLSLNCFIGGGQSRATGHQTLRIVHWNAEGVRQKKLELQQFLKAQKIDVCCIQETHLNNTHRFSIRGYEIHRVDRADRPKGGVLTLVKTSIPSTEVQRSEKADTEYITVKLILPDRNLTICNLYSPPNKAVNLQILQPNSKDWMIVGDFNSHSPSWGYPSLDAKGEEVEHWIVSNHLVLINTPTDPPTFYSRVWKTTSTPDIAIATDNIQKIAKREVSEQPGGSDHKPVILTLAKQATTSAEGRSRKMRGTQNECLGIAEEPSRSQNWNSKPCSKENTGSRTAESTHTGDDTESLS